MSQHSDSDFFLKVPVKNDLKIRFVLTRRQCKTDKWEKYKVRKTGHYGVVAPLPQMKKLVPNGEGFLLKYQEYVYSHETNFNFFHAFHCFMRKQ